MDLWTRFRVAEDIELLDVDIDLGDDLDLDEFVESMEGEDIDLKDSDFQEDPPSEC